MVRIDWHKIAILMFTPMTLPEACEQLGLDPHEVYRKASNKQLDYLLETSLLANCRNEWLGENDGMV